MVFSVNGSTGGTDIVATIINKYKSVSIGRALIYIDVVTVSASWFIFEDPNKLVYSMLQIYYSRSAVDYFLNGSRQVCSFYHPASTTRRLRIRSSRRSIGVLPTSMARGLCQESIKVIMVIARKTEVAISSGGEEVDPKAFITRTCYKGVYGQGFDVIKVNDKSM